MAEIRYKVLRQGRKNGVVLSSPYRNYPYELGRWYKCRDLGKPGRSNCVRGLYAVPFEGLLYRGVWRDCEEVYRCEVSGRCIDSGFGKQAWERMRIIEPLSERQVRARARRHHRRLGWLLEEALYPVNPLLIERSGPPTEAEIALLQDWSSVWSHVRNSVDNSVVASVGADVWFGVWNSVWSNVRAGIEAGVGEIVWSNPGTTVWNSVVASTRASTRSYAGSLFPRTYPDGYPYHAGADLWRAGLVPSYDGSTWRLHAGRNAAVVWEGEVK